MIKLSKNQARLKRNRRVRAKISGSAERPRLAVFKSLLAVYAQVIDDKSGKTLVQANLNEIAKAKNTVEGAREVGKLVAEKCKKANISTVVFDRSGYRFHGKVKALADGAREGGLNF